MTYHILDLFCGAGGAAMGYHRAGFEVVGVDISPQPDYPFTFVQMDALEYASRPERLLYFDAIHASPPCQAFTPLSALPGAGVRRPFVNLIGPTRDLLARTGLPYVIENVVQAPLDRPIRLCGQIFGLKLYRHRNFESSFRIEEPAHSPHRQLCMRAGYLPTEDRPYMSIHGRGGHNSKAWVAKAAEYMEVPWMSGDPDGVCESIPPAYTEYVGKYLRAHLDSTSTPEVA